MEAFLVEFANHFEFEMAEESSNIEGVLSRVYRYGEGARGEGGSDAVRDQVCSV